MLKYYINPHNNHDVNTALWRSCEQKDISIEKKKDLVRGDRVQLLCEENIL